MTLHPVTVAEVLARLLHAGQRYGPYDYFEHHIRGVVAIVRWLHPDNWRAITVAYLHDLMKDTPFTRRDLYALFPSEIAIAVDDLTKVEGVSYEAYIERIAEAPRQHGVLARIVKRADLTFNLYQIAATGRRNKAKHEAALARLREAR